MLRWDGDRETEGEASGDAEGDSEQQLVACESPCKRLAPEDDEDIVSTSVVEPEEPDATPVPAVLFVPCVSSLEARDDSTTSSSRLLGPSPAGLVPLSSIPSVTSCEKPPMDMFKLSSPRRSLSPCDVVVLRDDDRAPPPPLGPPLLGPPPWTEWPDGRTEPSGRGCEIVTVRVGIVVDDDDAPSVCRRRRWRRKHGRLKTAPILKRLNVVVVVW